MSLNHNERKEIIDKHLAYELKFLLNAATNWCVYKETLERKEKEDKDFPRHFIVYTLDSALLHARILYEFFTQDKKNNKYYYFSWKDFIDCGGKKLESKLYNRWSNYLHAKVVHLQKGRLEDNDAINKMVLCFAQDILLLWDEFSEKITNKDYKQLLIKTRDDAIKDAKESAEKYGITPAFS